MVLRCRSEREEGAASRRVHRRAAAAAEQQEEHAPAPGALLACAVGRWRSERLLLVQGQCGYAGHLDVAAFPGAAGVDEDAAGGEGGL